MIYRYDPTNHLTEYTKGGTTTTFTYDNDGNLTADNKARYTYDLFNRTEKVETFDGHVQINHYDAEGLRHDIEGRGWFDSSSVVMAWGRGGCSNRSNEAAYKHKFARTFIHKAELRNVRA